MPAYFDKQQRTWYVQFRYKDYTGRTRSTTKRGFSRKKDALEYEKKYKTVLQGTLNFPFRMLIDRYQEHLQHVVRPATYSHVIRVIRLYIAPFLSEIPVSRITAKTILDWRDTVLLPKQLSAQSLRSINGRLSAIFNYARRYYGLAANPVTQAGAIGSKRRQKEYHIWTRAELETLCQYIEQHSQVPHRALVFRLLFYTGMRPAELFALQVSDIDLEHKKIHITKSWHYNDADGPEKGYYTDPKTASSRRVITIPTFLADMLAVYIKQFQELGYTGRLFPGYTRLLNMQLQYLIKVLHLPPIRLYDLRHSHASALIAAGLDINLIAQRLGHTSPETTLRVYSHFYNAKNRDIATFLDEHLSKL